MEWQSEREPRLRLPASGGWEPGSDGWVNTGETALNVVIANKRKMLIRLDQNGTWSGPAAPFSAGADDVPPAQSCGPAILLQRRNVVSPSSSRQGQLLARAAHGTAGKGAERKPRPICNGSDRGCANWQHHPTPAPARHRCRGQTSPWSFVTREPWPTDPGSNADVSQVATPVGAAPGCTPDWHSIDWKKVHRTVRRLQARIVKAVREGRWGKVKALVYLLTHSFSGRALAILRVVTNSGAQTPGVDGIIWDSPELKSTAFSILRRHGYRPQPLRRVYIPKSNGKNWANLAA